ncbi:unnamed protein product [Discosporangium mesarthrocarpum]
MLALMVTFLDHLRASGAGDLVYAAMEKGAEVVQRVMRGQLQDAEKDMHILKASQISVNSAYLAKLPGFLATSLWDALGTMQLTEMAGRGRTAQGKGTDAQGMTPPSKMLEDISDKARDLIVELVRNKTDDLLGGIVFVNWEPSSMRRQPHPYADDLISYLRVTFMNLSTLPPWIREAVHFTSMSHVCTAILEHVIGPRVSSVNMLGIYNASLDVGALTDFADESGIGTLRECFAKLKQLIDIFLRNDIQATVDMGGVSPSYPHLDTRHLIALLEKYKDLSLAARIRNTVGDEVPPLEEVQIAPMLKKLKQRQHA